MNTLDELIIHYEKRVVDCEKERDGIVDRWNSEVRFGARGMTESDAKRMADIWEKERRLARDTVAWLKTIKGLK